MCIILICFDVQKFFPKDKIIPNSLGYLLPLLQAMVFCASLASPSFPGWFQCGKHLSKAKVSGFFHSSCKAFLKQIDFGP